MDLEKVSNIIMDQSLKDHVFSKEAGRICYTIVQVSKNGEKLQFDSEHLRFQDLEEPN